MKRFIDVIFSDVANSFNGGFKVYQGTLIRFSKNPCYIDIKLKTPVIYSGKKIEDIRCFPRGGTITGFFNHEVFPCSFADASLELKNRCFDLGRINLTTVPDSASVRQSEKRYRGATPVKQKKTI